MRSKQIGQVTPHLIDGYLIISLDSNWLKVFGGIPTFVVTIDEQSRLVLISESIKPKKEERLNDDN